LLEELFADEDIDGDAEQVLDIFQNPVYLHAKLDIANQLMALVVVPRGDQPQREGPQRAQLYAGGVGAGAFRVAHGEAVNYVAKAHRLVDAQDVHPVRSGEVEVAVL
jgi:hypothetical protein